MSKDYMTGGLGKWITYANPTPVNAEKKNPWENALGRSDQFAPITDVGGIALFRKQFSVDGLKSARIDATSLGVFDIWVNGRRVGRLDENGVEVFDEMKPGWTDYKERVLYYSYDLAPYLKDGENTLLIAVAPGWWNGRISLGTYGETHISLLAVVHLLDQAGERTLYTDDTWQGAWGSAIRASDIWDGELYDANEPTLQGLSKGCNCVSWDAVTTESYDIFVTPHIGPTIMVREGLARSPETIVVYNGTEDNGSDYGKIRVVRESKGENSFKLAKGETAVIDLGQNMVGWPTFTVRGVKGTTIQVRVGEMLNDSGLESRGNDNPEGSIYTINYRSAKAKAYYVLKGDEAGEYYCPVFTFFGFRYLEISATEDVEFTGLSCPVIGSATRETGKMETSHPVVNQLISNIIWGQRGNYLSVPTDCPQRDERLGWTGDTQAFCGTAAYNADVDGFFHKWLQDARDSQNEAGVYPDVIPTVRVVGFGGAAWSDAGIIVPYTMWKMYGDVSIIREHYESMEKYMGWLEASNMNAPNPHYGDWLAYEGTDARLICVAYYALDCMYMEAMCRAIGKIDRAEHYKATYAKVRDHFRTLYCDANGELNPENRTQCGYLLALRIGLLDEDKRLAAVAALKQKIIDNGYKLSTGFVGTCILNEVLAEFGENNLAYSLLLQTENPSWLYSIYQGATTIWERWNSYTKATGFGNVGMNSFNHYAYGAIQEWMYRHIAGIETTETAPGFAHPILQPKPDTRTPAEIPEGQELIKWAKTSFESVQGLIVSNWDTTDGFVYECTVPVASTLYLPILTDADTYTVNGVEKKFADGKVCPCGKALVLELDAGSYTFVQK
ncbi:MAG: family 78 glycoside hydrolase catalytic domain [Clostridia bacterium]|nr:family 78 glycoside hydrolase catalytic domain [Clostridia bacterium]